MDAFEPPRDDAGLDDATLDDDIGEVRTPFTVPLAAFAQLAAGGLTAAAGAQWTFLVTFYDWQWVVPPVFLVLGLLLLGVGGQIFRGRLWAALLSLFLSSVLALTGLVWVIYTTLNGLFAPLPLAAAAMAGLATLVTPLAIPACMRLTEQKKRLYA